MVVEALYRRDSGGLLGITTTASLCELILRIALHCALTLANSLSLSQLSLPTCQLISPWSPSRARDGATRFGHRTSVVPHILFQQIITGDCLEQCRRRSRRRRRRREPPANSAVSTISNISNISNSNLSSSCSCCVCASLALSPYINC